MKLSTSQREHLIRLVSPPYHGTAVMHDRRGWSRTCVNKLIVLGLVTYTPGGTTTRPPGAPCDVFTPGPATITITDAGRAAIAP